MPKQATAAGANYDKTGMTFTLSLADNWVKLVKGQNLEFSATLTLDKLTDTSGVAHDSFVLRTDTFDLNVTGRGPWPVNELGLGLEPVGTGNTCTLTSVNTFFAFTGSSAQIQTCSFPGGRYKIEPVTLQTGIGYKVNFSIDPGGQTLYNLDKPCGDTSGVKSAGCVGIYPYMILGGSVLTDKWFSLNSVAKTVYVTTYNTSQEAQAGVRPADIPANGSRTGNPDNTGSGDPILGLLNKIIVTLLGLVNEFIYFIFYWLIAPVIQATLSIHTYTDTFVNVIYPGWEVVRNVCNIFFIIAVIAIAMATLFRVEGYQFRSLLVQLIIAALLVNFSLVIAQGILAFADTIQNQFLPNNVDTIRALARDLMVTNTRDAILNVDLSKLGTFSYTVTFLFWVSLSLGSFLVFAALAVFLVIRIVALWVLLMISPVAYVAGVLPSTAGARQEWWSNFIKYAFFTPVIAFFLNMAAVMSNLVREQGLLQNITGADFRDSNFPGLTAFVFKVLSNVLLLVFIMIAIKVADQFGIFGASAVSEIAQKGVFAPFKATGWAAGKGVGALDRWRKNWGAHQMEAKEGQNPGFLNRLKFAISNPDALVKGWKARTAELDHMAASVAEARGREVTEQFRTAPKLKMLKGKWEPKLAIPYAQYVERQEENDFVKEYANMSKEKMMATAVQMDGWHGAEAEMRKRALIKAAASEGYLDDLLSTEHFANQYADEDGTYYSAEVLNRFLYGYLGNNEQTMRMLDEDLEELGKKTKHYEYLGHAQYNAKKGTFENGMQDQGEETTSRGVKIKKMKNTHQAAYAAGEFAKLGGRARVEAAPHNFTVLRGTKDASGRLVAGSDGVVHTSFGRVGGTLDEYNTAMWSKMDSSVIRESQHAQERLKAWLLGAKVDSSSGELLMDNEEQFNTLKELYSLNEDMTKAVYARKIGADPQKGDIKGIKVAILRPDGRHRTDVLGDPQLNTEPIATVVVDEISKYEWPAGNVMLSLKSEERNKAIKEISDLVEKVYEGQIKPSDLKNSLKVKFQAMGGSASSNADALTAELSSEILDRVATVAKKKHNPMPLIEQMDKEYKFTSKEIARLNKELSAATEAAFKTANAANESISRSFVETEVNARINGLRTNKDFPNLSKLTSRDVDLLISYINPCKVP